MKARIYLRVSRGGRKGIRVAASAEPQNEPLSSTGSYNKEFYPTVFFAVDFDLPDELFKVAERVVAEVNVGIKQAEVAGQIVLPEIKKLLAKKNKKNVSN